MQTACHWTNDDVTCTFTIKNDPSSNVPFAWRAASQPAGARFNIPSGSVSPGRSATVRASAALGCDVVFGFIDNRHHQQLTYEWTNTNC